MEAVSVREPGIEFSMAGTGDSAVFHDLLTVWMMGSTAGKLTVIHLPSVDKIQKDEERKGVVRKRMFAYAFLCNFHSPRLLVYPDALVGREGGAQPTIYRSRRSPSIRDCHPTARLSSELYTEGVNARGTIKKRRSNDVSGRWKRNTNKVRGGDCMAKTDLVKLDH